MHLAYHVRLMVMSVKDGMSRTKSGSLRPIFWPRTLNEINCPAHIFFSVQPRLTKFHVLIHPRTLWCVPRVYHCDPLPTLYELLLTYR